MRRYLGFLLLVAFTLLCSIVANAIPIYPEIEIDTETYFRYTVSSGIGTLEMMRKVGGYTLGGIDSTITYGPGSFDYLTPYTFCYMTIYIDPSTGKLYTSLSSTMEEKVEGGNITLSNFPGGSVTISDGTTLLKGTVESFSYKINDTYFSFTVELDSGSAGGVLAEGNKHGIYPRISDAPDIFIYGYLDGTTWNPEWWKSSWSEYKKIKEADKVPTPEPTTLLLLGTGIAGIAGAVTRRRKKK